MDYMKQIESIIAKEIKEAIEKHDIEEVEKKWARVDNDGDKSLDELIAENKLMQFGNFNFDFFDDPLGVVFIPYRDYAIMVRSRWAKKAEELTLIAEYAIYHAEHSWDENIKIMNDIRYDATYTLVSVCPETFENIALAVCHATASLYMKGGE